AAEPQLPDEVLMALLAPTATNLPLAKVTPFSTAAPDGSRDDQCTPSSLVSMPLSPTITISPPLDADTLRRAPVIAEVAGVVQAEPSLLVVIRPLSPTATNIVPVQAMPCRLIGVPPTTTTWPASHATLSPLAAM